MVDKFKKLEISDFNPHCLSSQDYLKSIGTTIKNYWVENFVEIFILYHGDLIRLNVFANFGQLFASEKLYKFKGFL